SRLAPRVLAIAVGGSVGRGQYHTDRVQVCTPLLRQSRLLVIPFRLHERDTFALVVECVREVEVHPTTVRTFIDVPHWSTHAHILRNADCRRLSQRNDEHLIRESRYTTEILRPVNSSAFFECLSNRIRLLSATSVFNRNRALRHNIEQR